SNFNSAQNPFSADDRLRDPALYASLWRHRARVAAWRDLLFHAYLRGRASDSTRLLARGLARPAVGRVGMVEIAYARARRQKTALGAERRDARTAGNVRVAARQAGH